MRTIATYRGRANAVACLDVWSSQPTRQQRHRSRPPPNRGRDGGRLMQARSGTTSRCRQAAFIPSQTAQTRQARPHLMLRHLGQPKAKSTSPHTLHLPLRQRTLPAGRPTTQVRPSPLPPTCPPLQCSPNVSWHAPPRAWRSAVLLSAPGTTAPSPRNSSQAPRTTSSTASAPL
jgi:hypothetical protein